MKIIRSVTLFGAIILLSFFAGSCMNNSYTHQEFLVAVDSIHAPDTVNANIPFEIEFFGTIGWDGCYFFSKFNQVMSNNDLTIEAWGIYDNHDRICSSTEVSLDGEKMTATIPTAGTYRIKVSQPYNLSLIKQIIVR
jgi:hypothetical protein